MEKRTAQAVFSVRRLFEADKREVLAHLLALSIDDRMLRFEALTSDDTLAKYVNGIDLERDCGLGLRNDAGRLVGFAHVANYGDDAELGISIEKGLRGFGCGERLMVDGLRWAKLSGFATFVVLTGKANHAMLGLAKKHGAKTIYDGSSACAKIDLRAMPEERLVQPLCDEAREPVKTSHVPQREPLPELGLAA